MRGQAHTLEAVVAAVLLVTSVLFAVQATVVTPLSASTSSQQLENQNHALAEGVLQRTADSGALRRAVLFWGDEDADGQREFHCSRFNQSYFTTPKFADCDLSMGDPDTEAVPPNDFGVALNRTFGSDVGINVRLRYRTSSGTEVQRLRYRGRPSDNAVTVSTTVALFDDDTTYDSSGDPTGDTVDSGAASYFAPDVDPGPLYNVLRVEVTVWQI